MSQVSSLDFLWDTLDPLDSRFCSIPAALGVEPIEINLLCVCVCVCVLLSLYQQQEKKLPYYLAVS